MTVILAIMIVIVRICWFHYISDKIPWILLQHLLLSFLPLILDFLYYLNILCWSVADSGIYYLICRTSLYQSYQYSIFLSSFIIVIPLDFFSCTNRWEYVLNRKNEFWFRTNYEAKKFKIVKSKINFEGTEEKIQSHGGLSTELSLSGLATGEVFSNTTKTLGYFGPIIDCIPEDVKGGILESANVSAGNVLVSVYQRMFWSIVLKIYIWK